MNEEILEKIKNKIYERFVYEFIYNILEEIDKETLYVALGHTSKKKRELFIEVLKTFQINRKSDNWKDILRKGKKFRNDIFEYLKNHVIKMHEIKHLKVNWDSTVAITKNGKEIPFDKII